MDSGLDSPNLILETWFMTCESGGLSEVDAKALILRPPFAIAFNKQMHEFTRLDFEAIVACLK